jgi:hypothetical protein
MPVQLPFKTLATASKAYREMNSKQKGIQSCNGTAHEISSLPMQFRTGECGGDLDFKAASRESAAIEMADKESQSAEAKCRNLSKAANLKYVVGQKRVFNRRARTPRRGAEITQR